MNRHPYRVTLTTPSGGSVTFRATRALCESIAQQLATATRHPAHAAAPVLRLAAVSPDGCPAPREDRAPQRRASLDTPDLWAWQLPETGRIVYAYPGDRPEGR